MMDTVVKFHSTEDKEMIHKLTGRQTVNKRNQNNTGMA